MGVVDKAIWKQYSGLLRQKLKNCRTSLCECITDAINEYMQGGDGLIARFKGMLDKNSVQSGVAGHAKQITERQEALRNAMKAYKDNGCGDGAAAHPEAASYLARKPPTVAEWEALHGRPMPMMSGWERAGWWALAGGAAIGAGILAFVPFDGPAGEVALGSAAYGAGTMALR